MKKNQPIRIKEVKMKLITKKAKIQQISQMNKTRKMIKNKEKTSLVKKGKNKRKTKIAMKTRIKMERSQAKKAKTNLAVQNKSLKIMNNLAMKVRISKVMPFQRALQI